MSTIHPVLPKEIIHKIVKAENFFPNNASHPFLLYKHVFHFLNQSTQTIQKILKDNNWRNSWVNGVYDYHHYHSNTHEVLIIFNGTCILQIGGEKGEAYDLSKGDVIIIPAGVSHKKLKASQNFTCIGAYPNGISYDMKYGKEEEHPAVDKNIKRVALPKADPIFGVNGILFDYWK